MEQETSKQTNASNKKRGKIILIICILVIIALVGVIAFLLLQRNGNDTAKRNVVVNEENAEDVAAELTSREVTPPGSYEVTMNGTWNFENGAAASSNAYVENSESNTNAVYFDVVRSDTGETIYASPILPVGSHLENITLDEKLPAGTYDCVCTYHLLDEDDNPISRVNVSVTIQIQN